MTTGLSVRRGIALLLFLALANSPVRSQVCSVTETAKLLPSGGIPGGHNDMSVAIDGDKAILGMPKADSAYFYRFDGVTWVEEQVVVKNSAPYFGSSASLSGNVAVIGASGDDVNGTLSGSAFIYRFDGITWVQEQRLLPNDGAAYDEFGKTASLSGNVAVIGAWRDDDNGSESGSAYVFRFDGTNWVREQKLLASDGAASDYFGGNLSLSGNVLMSGVPNRDDYGDSSGAAYLFRYNGTTWVEEQKLLATDSVAGDRFGASASLSGNVAVIGAYGDEDNGALSGSAYVFRFDGTTWVEEQKLLETGGGANGYFGFSVSVSGNVAVVGAVQINGSGSGSMYVYRFDGTTWVETRQLLASDGPILGRYVSAKGTMVLAGYPYQGGYVFDVSTPDLSAVMPDQGPLLGNNMVTLRGCEFTSNTEVYFDGIPALAVTWVDDTTLDVLVPPCDWSFPGMGWRPFMVLGVTADVTVCSPGSSSVLSKAYTYRLW
jgi:hypothetical protein